MNDTAIVAAATRARVEALLPVARALVAVVEELAAARLAADEAAMELAGEVDGERLDETAAALGVDELRGLLDQLAAAAVDP